MTTAEDLLAAQTERLCALDPLLPPAVAPPRGEVLTARCPSGPVAGVLERADHPVGSAARMWSASHVTELWPLLGAAGGDGLRALLAAWRDRMPELGLPDEDSAAVLTWPSRDVEACRVLLDHGFVPLSVIAVRTMLDATPATTPDRVRVRRAGRADLEACLELSMAEQVFSAQVGGTVLRAETPTLKRTLLGLRIDQGEPVWLAERDGVPVGLAECGFSDAISREWLASRVPAGRWGYVNCASVAPGARSHGIGQVLADHLHADFAAAGVRGCYLYYNPPNPLSSVFWPRQGYRPLWTVWEARPAAALR